MSRFTDLPRAAIGLDFGTTNTVLATALNANKARVETFQLNGDSHSTFRTAMCFWQQDTEAATELRFEAGPWAIERFIDDPMDCRFLQSFKTFAASKSFTETHIHGKKFTFEDLLAAFLSKLQTHVNSPAAPSIVVGRPVTFAGASPDAALALEHYTKALAHVGHTEVTYVYEPVAAAYFFAQRLTQAATVLVADFGGGTSDFSIIHFEPGAGKNGALKSTPLAHSGVAIAGDVFDYRILEHALFPQLGHRAKFKSIDKVLEVPTHFHHRFAQWNQLALMKSPAVLRDLHEFLRYALDQGPLGKFIALIENDLGYPLYKAVADAKAALSLAPSAELNFAASGFGFDVRLNAVLERSAFEAWIAPELEKIGAAVDEALASAGMNGSEIDRVFLTGGTSFVPAVRALFDARFNPEKIETGDQLESIAYGLALIARSNNPSDWAAN